jgi:hypothetical protein
MKLHWQDSTLVSCLHAAEACLRTPSRMDPTLVRALTPPASALQATLVGEGVSPDAFWSHAIPLAATIQSLHELAEIALTKIVGRAGALPRAGRVCGSLNDVKSVFLAAVLQPEEKTASARDALQQRWNCLGQGLLNGIVRWTEPDVLVEEASIIMVYPVLSGGGSAHLPYNSVRIEAVSGDPVAELPEILRLAWLLAPLNLDLPRYSDDLRPNRLALLAGLAMVPVVLSAATELGLDCSIQTRLTQALEVWLGTPEQTEAWGEILRVWWETYCTLRPAWATALQALDRLLP